MRFRPLILIANILFALTGCVAAAPLQQPAANPASLTTAASQFAPSADGGAYLTPLSLNLYRLLPPPPEAGSAQERAELDQLLRIQANRTPAQAQRALDDSRVTLFRFADALGSPPRFTAAELPLTTALFERIAKDESLFMNSAKDTFGRPRPFVTEKRLQPVVPRPPSASYPSGHTTWAVACAIVLADMIPEKRAQIFARAEEYAYNREVGGVHYPSDVAAGHLAGTALAATLFQLPRFLNDEVAATAELRQALGLPPLPRHQLYRH
jgi:acid phosphatase (class A)